MSSVDSRIVANKFALSRLRNKQLADRKAYTCCSEHYDVLRKHEPQDDNAVTAESGNSNKAEA